MTRLSRRSGFLLTLTALVVGALAPASVYGATPSAAATATPAPAAKNVKVIVTFDGRPERPPPAPSSAPAARSSTS